MPQYEFKCEKCGNIYTSIVKMCQEYDMCECCSGVTKRTHHDLTNPHLFKDITGAVSRPAYQDRNYE